jgi:HAD superfamily hydrolase (TIGR01509 family)
MQIDAVFFDLGKVLVDFDLDRAYRAAAQKSPLSEAEIREKVISPRIYEFEKGTISTEAFFQGLARDTEFLGGPEELRAIFDDIFTEMPNNVRVLEALRGRVRLGMISNTNASHIAFVERHFGFFHLFDCRIYSHEVQMRKPDTEIYRHALAVMDVPAERSLFIDDLEQNVRGALDAGMHALHLPPGQPLNAGSHPALAKLLLE